MNIVVTLYSRVVGVLFGGQHFPWALNGYPIKAFYILRKLAPTQELLSLLNPNLILYQVQSSKRSYHQKMSTPGLSQIWSLNVPLTGLGELPQAPKFDIWAVNAILLNRAVANDVAIQLNAIPSSETRLRDEGIAPLYSYIRKLIETLKAGARERGVTVPAFPDAPVDWREELSTDYKSLAALFRPYMTEPIRATMDRNLGLRDRDPKPHWASAPAMNSVALEIFIPLMEEMGGVLGGSEWTPFKAIMACDEIKWITRVLGEELVRIRAQPGSGWDEKEAKEMAMGQLKSVAGYLAAGA